VADALETALQLLRARHEARLAVLFPAGLAVKYPNSEFTKPMDAPWVDWRLRINHAMYRAAARSGGERRLGTVLEDVFVPRLLGTLLPAQIAGSLCTVWRPDHPADPSLPGAVIPGFLFDPSIPDLAGEARDDQDWYQVTVTTPFRFDFVPS
jgi:hypothetical protein